VHDWHGRTTVQAIGALLKGALLCVGLFTGTVNGHVFKAWLEQTLIPVLPKDAVVVMDNASFHKVHGVREIIERHGHTLEYLPPYSPDLNPIEPHWAYIKADRKRLRTDDIDFLFRRHLV
jgi:transposase